MAALYFAPFDYIESPSSFSSEKGGNTVFKLLSSLKIVSARTLKEGYHLFCVSGNNWFSDFAYKFTAINLYDNEVLHRHVSFLASLDHYFLKKTYCQSCKKKKKPGAAAKECYT